MSAMVRVAACLFALVGCTGAQAQAPATKKGSTPNPELVGMLTQQLNVTPAQATGGAGAIFGLAKSRLSAADFSKLSAAVPGMDGFLKAAPAPKRKSGGSSSLGSAGSMVPGGAGEVAGAGGIGSLAGSFQQLGLSPAMAGKFVPVLQNYVGSRGGSGAASLLGGVLKQ